MAIFVLLLIGFSLIFNQREFAARLVRPFFGLVIVLSLAPIAIGSCEHTATTYFSGGAVLALVVILLLAFIGWVLALRHKAGKGAHHVEHPSRPRSRALPPPPAHEEEP